MEFVFILVILILGFILLAYLINKQKVSGDLIEIMKMLQTNSTSDRNSLNQRLDVHAKVMTEVQKSVGELSEIGRNMRDLQQFLSSPKLRGNIGEQVLGELLSQSLPKSTFNLQYVFRSGEKVDAAVKTSAGIIPIDSKFPMENFRKFTKVENEEEQKTYLKLFEKDIKNHIDSISRKYILTDEGTIDYALMYIPSEAVYYEVVNNTSLFDYASSKRVLPVSPTTFYAYLKAILMSFEGQKVEAKAKEIVSSLRAIQKDYEKIDEQLSVLGKHVTNASNMFGSLFQTFGQLGQKINSTQSLGREVKEEIKEIES